MKYFRALTFLWPHRNAPCFKGQLPVRGKAVIIGKPDFPML